MEKGLGEIRTLRARNKGQCCETIDTINKAEASRCR